MPRKGQVSTCNAGARASPVDVPPTIPSRPGTTHHQGSGNNPLNKATKGFSTWRNLCISIKGYLPLHLLTLEIEFHILRSVTLPLRAMRFLLLSNMPVILTMATTAIGRTIQQITAIMAGTVTVLSFVAVAATLIVVYLNIFRCAAGLFQSAFGIG